MNNEEATSNELPVTPGPEEAIALADPSHDIGLLFLSNFVHQVVNPMNGVIGTLSNITDGTYPENVVKQKINASRAQLEQCISLIRNLAYISDYFFETSDKAALRPPNRETGTSILPQVVIEAVQFFQVIAEKKRIALELVDGKSQYRVAVRPELLKQVFINLFDNWLKYGESHQKIIIDTKVNKNKSLIVSLVGKSIGFDGADAENIFNLGFRARQARGVVAQGSGIGLHVCRQIMINELGGSIRAEHNRATSVTTFTLTIPSSKWQL